MLDIPEKPAPRGHTRLAAKTVVHSSNPTVTCADPAVARIHVSPMFHDQVADFIAIIEDGTFLAKLAPVLDVAPFMGRRRPPCTDLSTVGVDKDQLSLLAAACATFVTKTAAMHRNPAK
jgi:hypothetical protein